MPRALQRIEQISLFGRYELLGEPCRNCGLGCTCTPSTASSLGKVNLAWFRVSSGVCLELNSCACQKQYLGMRQQPAQVLLFISWDMQGGTEHFSFLCCFTTHTLLGMVKREHGQQCDGWFGIPGKFRTVLCRLIWLGAPRASGLH